MHKTVTCTHKTLLHCSWEINTVGYSLLKATYRKNYSYFSFLDQCPAQHHRTPSPRDLKTHRRTMRRIVDTSSSATPVKGIIKFPAAAFHSIRNKAENGVMCKFRATCHVSVCLFCRAGWLRPERSAPTLQHTAYSKRIISPIL